MSRTQRSLRGSSHVRLRVALVIMAMLLSLFGARLFQLQGVDAKSYATRAAETGLVTVELPASRGRILDREGRPLAKSVAGLMLVADPTRTAPNAEAIAKIVTDELGLDYFDLMAALTKRDTRFVYLARRVPSTKATAVMDRIRSRDLVGVDTRPDPLRVYPAGDVAANLLGFVGEAPKPAGGLELAFDRLLAGKDGSETYEVGGGNRIPLGDNSQVKPVDGRDLELTIDLDLQWYTQRLLRSAVQGAGAVSGVAVVLDSRTGEVLSLADYPTYDPNEPGNASKDDLRSRALTDVYEPGSVEKVLTAAGLLDAGMVSPETRINVPAELPVLDRTIGDWFDHGAIRLTMAGVIARSSNIGTALAAEQFTPHEMWGYLDAFGLGRRTDVGLLGETRGLLPRPDSWSKLTRAQIAFGQGLSVNALQMAAAVNTLANRGEFISPSLIRGRATNSAGREVGTETAVRRQVVSPDAAGKTAEMMELVTTPGVGTAGGAGIEGYRVAGKTGTAQQVGEKCRCYDGSTAVSFAGFAPADDPRFTVYVMINRPRAGSSGGGTAAPVFRKLMVNLLSRYAVPPTGTRPSSLPIKWGRGADAEGR